ncbi:hypothetical protein FHS29_000951 [Saccharothrix tamanrassetensis]|uniref:Secreted protein n=1 Tax=Saccharothrix tamanrassetensis TaxID=1051531 RepID=A0A841CAZ6_9PSEU|nr:hypothetical protein [Saccharothrix tamanrassetensis]MBB5954381.1 hypothetical protein [Saccharothrix tamanrassetensis]
MKSHRMLAAVGAVAADLVWVTPSAALAEPDADGASTGAACRPHGHSAKDKFDNGYPCAGRHELTRPWPALGPPGRPTVGHALRSRGLLRPVHRGESVAQTLNADPRRNG